MVVVFIADIVPWVSHVVLVGLPDCNSADICVWIDAALRTGDRAFMTIIVERNGRRSDPFIKVKDRAWNDACRTAGTTPPGSTPTAQESYLRPRSDVHSKCARDHKYLLSSVDLNWEPMEMFGMLPQFRKGGDNS
jgi:hypothetical protein